MNLNNEIVQYSINLPSTIVHSYVEANKGLDNDVDSMEMSIQQEIGKPPKRFLQLFLQNDQLVMLYFRHNSEEIESVYKKFACIKPSEIAPAHWSKIEFPNQMSQEIVKEIVFQSYQLILSTLSRKRQSEIKWRAEIPNRFIEFDNIARNLCSGDTQLSYSLNHPAHQAPCIVKGIIPVVYYFDSGIFLKTSQFKERVDELSSWEKEILNAIKAFI